MPQEYRHDLPNPTQYRRQLRSYLLYILPSPLILKLLVSILSVSLIKVLMTGAALFFFYSAAHLTRTTLLRLAENKTLRKPKPIADYRRWSAVYVAVGIIIVMFMLKRPPIQMLLMAGCGALGYYLTYGFREKVVQKVIDYDTMPNATREAIQGAFKDLDIIENLGEQLDSVKDQGIIRNLNNVLDSSHNIMTLLVKSPNDAGRARRFLSVYTNRIKEILSQYIELSKHGKADDFRTRLTDVLAETNKAFSEKQSELLDDDKFKLDVQLEVLDEQIKHEQKKPKE